MWQNGEINQGDSGSVVAGKLDAEFARIQLKDDAQDTALGELKYADIITVGDPSQAKLIVSPYTMWHVLTPYVDDQTEVKKVVDHLSEELFDGRIWIRSDVMFEYRGTYISLQDLDDGYMITKAHITELEGILDDKYILADGSVTMPTGYAPTDPLSIATKEYVDNTVNEAVQGLDGAYVEHPPATAGDTAFAAPINGRPFVVYLNGVLQRRAKYSYNDSGITFSAGLDTDDEVTITVLGA